jgi:5-hydroxyisourate hydrolase-like protein (transthyretin family)
LADTRCAARARGDRGTGRRGLEVLNELDRRAEHRQVVAAFATQSFGLGQVPYIVRRSLEVAKITVHYDVDKYLQSHISKTVKTFYTCHFIYRQEVISAQNHVAITQSYLI